MGCWGFDMQDKKLDYLVSYNQHEYRILLPQADQDYIQGGIARTGKPYEAEMLLNMQENLPPAGLFVDVGANIGNHSLYMLAAGASVIAIEPNKTLAQALRQSIELNKWSERASVMAVGAGRKNALASFKSENLENLGAMSLAVGAGDVEVMRLDDIVKTQKPDIIKIDVEGMELDVLMGARKTIENARPLVYIESIKKDEFRVIYDWFEQLNYVLLNTFNASPTHLFAPVEGVPQDVLLRSSQQRFEEVMRYYDLLERNKVLTEALERSNEKYRHVTQQQKEAREKLDAASEKYRNAIEQTTKLKQDLGKAELLGQQYLKALQHSEKTVADLKQEIGSEISQIKDFFKTSENKSDALELQHRSGFDQLRGVISEIQKTSLEVLVFQESLAKERQLHAEQLATLMSDKEKLSVDYRSALRECDGLREKLNAHEVAHQALLARSSARQGDDERRLRALEDQKADLNTRLMEATRQSEDFKSRLEEISAQYRHLNEESLLLKKEAQFRFNELEQLQRTQENLQLKLADAEQELAQRTAQFEQASHRMDALAERLAQTDATLARETERLHLANTKYRQSTTNEKVLNARLLKMQQELVSARQEVRTARQKKEAAEKMRDKTRAMLSFQLGDALLNSTKSVRNFVALPGTLWGLVKVARQRRQEAREAPVTQAMRIAQTAATSETAPASQVTLVTKSVPAVRPSTDVAVEARSHALQELDLPLKQLKVACIMDEFTFSSYQPECDLMQLSVEGWQAELEAFKPQLLFIESAWRGKDEAWGSKVGHMSEELQGIVNWCRAHSVPTIFWNKEDPVHFETFLNTARLFDCVFTTDIDCIHRYKAALNHDRVYLLPFACQPAVNNPIEKYPRKDAFCFAGAYYVRYPERTRDLGNFSLTLNAFRPLEIYDRNFGKDDSNYQFPDEYRPYIVGNLPYEQIDKAYKGYRFAINLNSIKQSQSMFARRVYELLASNTVTVSNFSRGVRLLFGDLVLCSDDGHELIARLNKNCTDELRERKFRLAGLRKVMGEHTYADRLSYIVAKVAQKPFENDLPQVLMLAFVKNQADVDSVLASFGRQKYVKRRLLMIAQDGFKASLADGENIAVVPESFLQGKSWQDLLAGAGWLAPMVAQDYYGPHYVTDLALATRYTDAACIGKPTCHVFEDGSIYLTQPGKQYQMAEQLALRSCLLKAEAVASEDVRAWVKTLDSASFAQGFGIDEFNYCRAGAGAQDIEQVDDLSDLDEGISLGDLLQRAEAIEAAQEAEDADPFISGADLYGWLGDSKKPEYSLAADGSACEISSILADGKHEYIYARQDRKLSDFNFGKEIRLNLDATPGLNVQIVVLFLDEGKKRLGHAQVAANRNLTAALPEGTQWLRFGLRVYGSGETKLRKLIFGHRVLQPAAVIGRARQLVLTNHYPSYDDLYRNGFVHTRVKAYEPHGVCPDVFRLRPEQPLSYHEFQGVDVITGSAQALDKLLTAGQYESVLVHFLDAAMWEVLRQHIDRIRVVVWVHGAEVQPWHRRDFNFTNEKEREAAKQVSDKRMAFWRGLLKEVPENLKFVFVSRYFAEEVMEDMGFRLPESAYCIVHNPIDTDLFSYREKPMEQRKKILSIRPYASRTYANDLSVAAILELSKKPYFKDLSFRMIGDGVLFEDVLRPLRQYPNVKIEKRFLKQSEIADLHKEYGVFLCPSRMDTQGVSRDEAMASGLVPVTNAVAAIPDFVDETCGVLAQAEDSAGMAAGIARLYEDEALFARMSRAAAERVRKQSDAALMVRKELDLILNKTD